MENNRKTSSAVRKDLSQLKEDSKTFSITNNKCHLPLIPIYPLRYALSTFYLNEANVSLDTESPRTPKINEITVPSSMRRDSIHQLQQLRQGFIYIYSPTRHQYIATDKKDKWLVFRYFTHKDDVNSANQFPAGGKEAEGLGYRFILYQWEDNASKHPWKVADIPPMDTVFVDKTQQWVYMAYSEYPWSAEMLEQLDKDEHLRNGIMSKIDVTNQSTTANSASFDEINSFAIEFDNNEKALFDMSKNWFTRTQKAHRLPTLCGEQTKGLIVGLKDVVGELRELQNILYRLTQAGEAYYQKYVYPLTIGNIIDPKVAYDVRGEAFPFKMMRVIEQKGVKEALSNQFESKYRKLVNQGYEWYEKPAKAVIEQINGLYQWMPLKDLVSKVIPNALHSAGKENHEAIDHTVYVFNRLLTDMVIGLESTPEGEKLLTSLLTAPESGRGEFGNEQYRKTIKETMDTLNAAIISIQDIHLRQKAFDKFYHSMEQFYTFAGNSLIKAWLKGGECSIPKEQMFSNYNILMQKGEPAVIFVALAERIINTTNNHLKQDATRKARKRMISQLKKQLKEEQMNWQAEFEAWSAQAAVWEKRVRFLGVLAAFNGIKSLDVDLSKKKLSHTAAGRFAQDPVLQKATAILDITIGTTDAAYGMGLIQNPGQFVPMNSHTVGGVLKAVGTNLRTVAYLGAGGLAGVLAAVIATGGITEAWKNNDNIALVGNVAVFTGGATGAVLTAVSAFNFAVNAVVLGVVGAIAFALVLIGGLVVNLWGKTPLQVWVENGFWGKSKQYFYWDNKKRASIGKQIEDAQILVNEEAIQEAQPFLQLPSLIITGDFDGISGSMPQLTEKAKDYLMIKNGFEEELYEYLIQSGLQIYTQDNRQFTLFYAEFEKTRPTLANLEIYCTSYRRQKRKRITQFSYALRNVRFSLIENGIMDTDIALSVVFTDREGEQVRRFYESEGWKAQHKQDIDAAFNSKDE